jgi:hypothetical protein
MENAPGNDPAEDAPQEDPAAQPEPPAVEPVSGDQGESAPTDAAPVGGHDPSQPRATSAAPPEAQSGVPDIPDGANDGVEAPGDGDATEADTGQERADAEQS